jgi:glycosyltransferase involved in cell wall biosynthesis
MRILALALGVPFPPIGGGLTRTFHLLRSLASHHHVTLVAFTYGDAQDPPPYAIEVIEIPWRNSPDYEAMTGGDLAASQQAYRRLAFDTDEPWFASVMDPEAMRTALSTTGPYDVVLLEGTPLARFLPAIPRHIPRVLDLFDIHSTIAQRAARQSAGGDPALDREFERTLAFEREAVANCDLCFAVSDADATTARDLLGASVVHVVPNGVDTSYFMPATAATEPGMLLFTGRMSYGPNIDAVQHFVGDILPRIRTEVPDATFHIVGASPTAAVSALAGDSVVVHGRVDDVRPFQHRAEVVVVPIRAGGGTRLKVLEAAACGKAIVSTELGAEGLPLVDGRDLVIAATSGDFAAAVVALLRDAGQRQNLGIHARAATSAFDWTTIADSARAIIEQLIVADRG